MKLPSWRRLNEGISKFEQQIKIEKDKFVDEFQRLKDTNPILDEVIRTSVSFLPQPFNGIAQAIYDSFESTKKNKAIDEILKFLNDIKKGGEEHYNRIVLRLDYKK